MVLTNGARFSPSSSWHGISLCTDRGYIATMVQWAAGVIMEHSFHVLAVEMFFYEKAKRSRKLRKKVSRLRRDDCIAISTLIYFVN